LVLLTSLRESCFVGGSAPRASALRAVASFRIGGFSRKNAAREDRGAYARSLRCAVRTKYLLSSAEHPCSDSHCQPREDEMYTCGLRRVGRGDTCPRLDRPFRLQTGVVIANIEVAPSAPSDCGRNLRASSDELDAYVLRNARKKKEQKKFGLSGGVWFAVIARTLMAPRLEKAFHHSANLVTGGLPRGELTTKLSWLMNKCLLRNARATVRANHRRAFFEVVWKRSVGYVGFLRQGAGIPAYNSTHPPGPASGTFVGIICTWSFRQPSLLVRWPSPKKGSVTKRRPARLHVFRSTASRQIREPGRAELVV